MLFREVNERLRETVGSFEGPLEFVCECSNEDCIETIGVTLGAYEDVRAHANLFIVAPGHEVLEVDRVVDQGPSYLLVEKIVAADAVAKADPRSRE
jgi:hypothetical protein